MQKAAAIVILVVLVGSTAEAARVHPLLRLTTWKPYGRTRKVLAPFEGPPSTPGAISSVVPAEARAAGAAASATQQAAVPQQQQQADAPAAIAPAEPVTLTGAPLEAATAPATVEPVAAAAATAAPAHLPSPAAAAAGAEAAAAPLVAGPEPLTAAARLAAETLPGEYIVIFHPGTTARPMATMKSLLPAVALKAAAANPAATARAAGADSSEAAGVPLTPAAAAALAPAPFTVRSASADAPVAAAGAPNTVNAAAGGKGAAALAAAGGSYVFPVKVANIELAATADASTVISALKAQPGVADVIPNTRVRVKQAQTCATPDQLAGIAPAHWLSWPGCTGPSRVLVFYGHRCGPNLDLVQWAGVYTAERDSMAQVPGCHINSGDARYGPGTPLGAAVFGSCGVPPTAVELPAQVCAAAAASAAAPSPCAASEALERYEVPLRVGGCGVAGSAVALTGTHCGGGLIAWTRLSIITETSGALVCTQAPAGKVNPLFDRQWFGSCGVPPAYMVNLPTRICGVAPPAPSTPPTPSQPPSPSTPPPQPTPPPPTPFPVPSPSPPPSPPPSPSLPLPPSPSPPPSLSPPPSPSPSPSPSPPPGSGQGLQYAPLIQGEWDLPGMQRIQAVVDKKVPALPANSTLTVAVIDTGGSNLPDLNTVAGVAFVRTNPSSIPWADVAGHGTHVSGTIGGRNNGAGVFGVLPGVKILPIKVLSDEGFGSIGDVMAGIDYAATNAEAFNIGVINLSLGGIGTSAMHPVCASVRAAVERGLIVVAASGNSAMDASSFLPAACPDAVAVTALDAAGRAPAGFSNWQAATAAPAERRRTVAAPGENILSTLPEGRLEAWSGTSMAAPHVSGVAARCFASGECRLANGPANTAKFLDSIWAKFDSDASYRWSSTNTVDNRYYGPLVWAARY